MFHGISHSFMYVINYNYYFLFLILSCHFFIQSPILLLLFLLLLLLSRTLKKFQCPSRESNRGPFNLQSSTLPRRYKSRLVPQGSTSVSYTKPIPCDILPLHIEFVLEFSEVQESLEMRLKEI